MFKNCNIVGCAVNSTIVVNNPYEDDRYLAEVVREHKRVTQEVEQSRLENFYAGML